MNFLFGVAQGSVIVIVMILLWIGMSKVVPTDFKESVVFKDMKKGYMIFTFLVFFYILYSSAMTYGPRITLDKTDLPSSPDRVEVVPSEEGYVEFKDRIGQFDDRLENDDPRKREE